MEVFFFVKDIFFLVMLNIENDIVSSMKNIVFEVFFKILFLLNIDML